MLFRFRFVDGNVPNLSCLDLDLSAILCPIEVGMKFWSDTISPVTGDGMVYRCVYGVVGG